MENKNQKSQALHMKEAAYCTCRWKQDRKNEYSLNVFMNCRAVKAAWFLSVLTHCDDDCHAGVSSWADLVFLLAFSTGESLACVTGQRVPWKTTKHNTHNTVKRFFLVTMTQTRFYLVNYRQLHVKDTSHKKCITHIATAIRQRSSQPAGRHLSGDWPW